MTASITGMYASKAMLAVRQHAQTRHERAGGIGPVISGNRRLVDVPHSRHRAESEVRDDPDEEVGREADADEAKHSLRDARVHLRQLFTAMPSDRQQQIDRERLVHHIRKLELNFEDGDKKSQVEKQKQRLEEVVLEVVPELLEQGATAARLVAR